MKTFPACLLSKQTSSPSKQEWKPRANSVTSLFGAPNFSLFLCSHLFSVVQASTKLIHCQQYCRHRQEWISAYLSNSGVFPFSVLGGDVYELSPSLSDRNPQKEIPCYLYSPSGLEFVNFKEKIFE